MERWTHVSMVILWPLEWRYITWLPFCRAKEKPSQRQNCNENTKTKLHRRYSYYSLDPLSLIDRLCSLCCLYQCFELLIGKTGISNNAFECIGVDSWMARDYYFLFSIGHSHMLTTAFNYPKSSFGKSFYSACG